MDSIRSAMEKASNYLTEHPEAATGSDSTATAVHEDGLSFRVEGPWSCCPVTNFFASEVDARDYLADNPGIDGQIVSITQAADAGRALFGQLLSAQ